MAYFMISKTFRAKEIGKKCYRLPESYWGSAEKIKINDWHILFVTYFSG